MAVVCVKDACGWLVFLLIYGIMAYCDYVVIYWIAYKHLTFTSIWSPVVIALFNACLLCLSLSHIRTVITDPGRVPFPDDKKGSLYRGVALLPPANGVISQKPRTRWITSAGDEETDVEAATSSAALSNNTPDDAAHRKIVLRCIKNDWTECRRCNMLRPPRSHHCRSCKRCIRRMDHHCPWVNNCVGAENQKYFLQFLFWTAVSTFYAGSATIGSWIASDCNSTELFALNMQKTIVVFNKTTAPTTSNCIMTDFEQQNRILHAILILMVCALFFIFSIIMFVDQVSCIVHDRSTVEKASGEEWERHMTSFDRLREVCGIGVPFCWLLPCFSRKLPEHERFIDFTVDVVGDENDDGVGAANGHQQTTAIHNENWPVSYHHQHAGGSVANRRQGNEVDGGGCVEEMRPLATCTRAGGATGDDSDDVNNDDDDEDTRFV